MSAGQLEAIGIAGDAANLLRQLRRAPDAELAGVYAHAERVAATGWVAMALAVGVAHERHHAPGAKVCEKLGEVFGRNRATIYRLLSVYVEILRPRLDHGKVVVLPESQWAHLAVRLAPKLRRRPLDLYAAAERAKAADPRLRPSRWERSVLGLTEVDPGEKYLRQLRSALRRLADADVEEFAQVDPSLIARARDVLVTAAPCA